MDMDELVEGKFERLEYAERWRLGKDMTGK